MKTAIATMVLVALCGCSGGVETEASSSSSSSATAGTTAGAGGSGGGGEGGAGGAGGAGECPSADGWCLLDEATKPHGYCVGDVCEPF